MMACSSVPSIDLSQFPQRMSKRNMQLNAKPVKEIPIKPLDDINEALANEIREPKLESSIEAEESRGEENVEEEERKGGPPPLSLMFPESSSEGKEAENPEVSSTDDVTTEPAMESDNEIGTTQGSGPENDSDIEKKNEAKLQMELKHLIDILKKIEKKR